MWGEKPGFISKKMALLLKWGFFTPETNPEFEYEHLKSRAFSLEALEDVRPASLQEKLPTIPSAAADAVCWCKTSPSLGGSFLVEVDRGNNGYQTAVPFCCTS